MNRILLDFPWPIDAVLDADPTPLMVIKDFSKFRSCISLNLAPIVDAREEAQFWEKLSLCRSNSSLYHCRDLDFVCMILDHISGAKVGQSRATPIEGPNDLRDVWLKILRTEMNDLTNWRTPQVVVSSRRFSEWANCVQDGEIPIKLEDHPEDAPQKRVLVVMNSYGEASRYRKEYEANKYAVPDSNPWDLRNCRPDSQAGQHCLLPRPACLADVPLRDLERELHSMRSESWPKGGKYWFIPPDTWSVEMDKNRWRRGAFKEEIAQNRRKGPIDYKDQIWCWHPQEGHWDVQLRDGSHKKVKPNGDPWD